MDDTHTKASMLTAYSDRNDLASLFGAQKIVEDVLRLMSAVEALLAGSLSL